VASRTELHFAAGAIASWAENHAFLIQLS
jgi:hypothetical protein